jgi:hypothetical protein
MKSLSLAKPKENLDLAIAEARALDPSIVLLFAAPELLRDAEVVGKLAAGFQDIPAIGCSTSGEITAEGLFDNTVAMLALKFEATPVRTTSVYLAGAEESEKVGAAVGAQLAAPDLKAVFVLSPGLNVNGSALVKGLYGAVGEDVVVTGGLAGDGLRFKDTQTFFNGSVSKNHVVAFGLYGDAINVSGGSEGGWRPFGPARLVTRSEGNVLFELDGKQALSLYDEYLGTVDRALPASRLSYPLAILREDRSNMGLIRSALGIDAEKNALILAGDLPQGSLVCLMHANTEGLIQGAAQAATEAMRVHKSRGQKGVAILVSCVGRRMVMNIDTDEEIEAVRDSFEDGMTIAGYYSYGEICPFAKTKRPELHNQTMTITYITEKKPFE